MRGDAPIRAGQVLTGPLFSEPMRVVTVRATGPKYVQAGLVGQRSERFLTHCASAPELQEPIRDPARFPWHEVTQVAHYSER